MYPELKIYFIGDPEDDDGFLEYVVATTIEAAIKLYRAQKNYDPEQIKYIADCIAVEGIPDGDE